MQQEGVDVKQRRHAGLVTFVEIDWSLRARRIGITMSSNLQPKSFKSQIQAANHRKLKNLDTVILYLHYS